MPTRREQLAPLRQDIDDLLCRLLDGAVQKEEVAAWAGARLNEHMPINGHMWNAGPRLWETRADMLDPGPPWNPGGHQLRPQRRVHLELADPDESQRFT